MRTARLISAALLLLAAPVGGPWGPRPLAAQRALSVESFHADVRVGRDGVVRVDEQLRVRFRGPWDGIDRTIPVAYSLPDGSNRRIRIENLSARDGAGSPLKLERQRSGAYLKLEISVPDAHNVIRDIVLHYEVPHALDFHPDRDELYWNVTGTQRDMPIQSASATVYLPDDASEIRTDVYTGPYGSKASNAVTQRFGTSVGFRTDDPLDPGEGLSVLVDWAPGSVARPGARQRALAEASRAWPLVLPLIAFLSMFLLWWGYGEDSETGPVAVPHERPQELSPAEMQFMDGETGDLRGITATIVDLAVRGLLSIEERVQPAVPGSEEKTDYAFVRRAERSEWLKLLPHEREVIAGLFDEGRDTSTTSDLKGEFYKSAQRARARVKRRIVDARLYGSDPVKVRSLFTILGVVSGAAIAILGAYGYIAFEPSTAVWILSGIGVALAIFGWGWFMPARTRRGATVRAQAEAFREFLSRVDDDGRDPSVLKPEMFNRYLPYAIALGIEDRWAQRFDGVQLPPPQWYSGPTPLTGFSATGFVQASADFIRRQALEAGAKSRR